MNQTTTGLDGQDAQRVRIEHLLARYPELEKDEIDRLVRWFRKEASAYDVAILASNEDLRSAYGLFRRHHIDRLTARDIANAILFVAAVLAITVAIAFMAPA
jgi:hypothetical protein